jgi:hypothetical protein
LLAALNTWARDGIPKNPQAWLLTAARNRLLDHARHLEVRERSASTLETLANELYAAPDPAALPDERLKLLFVCAHLAIDPAMHTPLMLQTVLGLDAVAIGRGPVVQGGAAYLCQTESKELRALPHEARAHAMQSQQVHLLRRLDRHKVHGRSLHGFRDRLGIAIVVLVTLEERFHVLGRDQTYVVTKRCPAKSLNQA